ncbi:MAG TPA: hypothetical protein VFC07_15500 [Verrucomicrobiae bacterium]|nr:hypothetical protein [Verrucomicrobiae bacterium]
MIRGANIEDVEPITNGLWKVWQHLKARQIGTPMQRYKSRNGLADEIRNDLTRWLVYETPDPNRWGFFALSHDVNSIFYKKMGFPEDFVTINHFACLLKGEILLEQFQALSAYLPDESVSLSISTTLRDAYWAALKAGFKLLGEQPLVVGEYAWLYLDRERKFEMIQTKLIKARMIIS